MSRADRHAAARARAEAARQVWRSALVGLGDDARALWKHLAPSEDEERAVAGMNDPAELEASPRLLAIAYTRAAIFTAHDAAAAARANEKEAAVVLVVSGHRLLLHATGQIVGLVLGASNSELARVNARMRHAPTRDARALVMAWWRQHGEGRRMSKEAGAEAIADARLVSETRATVRRWLIAAPP